MGDLAYVDEEGSGTPRPDADAQAEPGSRLSETSRQRAWETARLEGWEKEEAARNGVRSRLIVISNQQPAGQIIAQWHLFWAP